MNDPALNRPTADNADFTNLKRPKSHDLAALCGTMPAGRGRVALALVVSETAPTYRRVADALGISLGTVHRHLKRVRDLHPEVYGALMGERQRQLAARHEEAEQRAAAHSECWHRSQANRRYYYRFAHWPWESRR